MIVDDFPRPTTFFQAVMFMDAAREHGYGCGWSVAYWGFGEHFTYWAGYGTFIDFNLDQGDSIGWVRMKEIILESAQNLWDEIKDYQEGKENNPGYRDVKGLKPGEM